MKPSPVATAVVESIIGTSPKPVRELYESEVALSLEYPDLDVLTRTVLDVPGARPETVTVPVSEIVAVELSRELVAFQI